MYGWILLFTFFIFQITNYARNYIHLLCFLFRIFILLHGFITIFLVRYSFGCTVHTHAKRKGGRKWRTRQKETASSHNLHKSPLLSHSPHQPIPNTSFTQYFYCIIIHILCRSVYILCACVRVCVLLTVLLLLPAFSKRFSIHAFGNFCSLLTLSILLWVSISLLFFFSLPLFVRYRKIMHK